MPVPETIALPAPSTLTRIFRILSDGQPQTRASLAAATGMARSTISGHLDVLTSTGLIEPVGNAASTGGRPSTQFALNASSRVIIAVDLGAAHCRTAITDLRSRSIVEARSGIDIADGPKKLLAQICIQARELLAQAGRPGSEVIGLGIGLPGPVAYESGRLSMPPIMPGWDGYDVRTHLAEEFGVPVLVDNDVNVMALGERTYAWPDVDNFVFVKVGTGIGAGIISSGVLQRGAQGIAGDLGRLRVPVAVEADPGHNTYSMQNLESIAGGAALAAGLRAKGFDVKDGRGVARLLAVRDPEAVADVRQAGRHIGEALESYVCILNPSVIILGGGLALASEDLLAGVREVVYARSFPPATANLTIETASSGSEAGILGASRLAIDHVLESLASPE